MTEFTIKSDSEPPSIPQPEPDTFTIDIQCDAQAVFNEHMFALTSDAEVIRAMWRAWLRDNGIIIRIHRITP